MLPLILGFLSILLVTFSLVVVMTSRSAMEKSVGRRMASIQSSGRGEAAYAADNSQLFKIKRTGRLGWLEERLESYQVFQKLQKRIMQAHSSATVSTLIISSLSLAIVGYAVAWLFAPLVLINVAAAAIIGALPYGIISFKRSRRINAFNAVLAESIDMLARALRAGYSMVGAIEMLSENAQEPAASEFREVFKQQNLGMPLRDALLQLLERMPALDLRVLVTAILVQRDTGGNLAEILDRTVFVIRERLRIQGEIRTHTAQGRLTAWILSALPLVMLVLINGLNPGYSTVFLHDPLGRKLIYVSFGMLTIGSVIIRKIVNGIEV